MIVVDIESTCQRVARIRVKEMNATAAVWPTPQTIAYSGAITKPHARYRPAIATPATASVNLVTVHTHLARSQ